VPNSVSHVAAATLFAGLAVVWMAPVLADGSILVPDDGPGDNIGFVWNGWWRRHALSIGQWPLWTGWLFAPAGVDLTLHTYVDYYYAIYAALLLGLLVLARSTDATLLRGPLARWQSRTVAMLTALALVAVGVAAAIAVTGGGVFDVAGRKISTLTATNPLSAAGLLALVALVVTLVPRIRLRPDGTAQLADLRRLWLTVAVAALALLPLAFAALRLWQRGDYVSQRTLPRDCRCNSLQRTRTSGCIA
jgi:hypothetical protein